MNKQKLVVLTGAGISAESGLQTFRDSDGLWEGYNIEDVATRDAWHRNPALVQDFYNQRRKAVLEAQPNKAHYLLADLEKHYDVTIITQNIDNLHERAGSQKVLHLHGIITKSQSTKNAKLVNEIEGWELKMGDTCELGSQLRPFIVWFGEAVPEIENAASIVSTADIFMIIGTSLVVYPAAGLARYTLPNIPIYIIDKGSPEFAPSPRITFIQQSASVGLKKWIEQYHQQ
ncbi:NAD-dependent deacetylase [Bacteroidetes bacterium UKL13-3]|nr:NAD-dependent deacetylase [Bacteroidetes bacterium UKL13-3]HCP92470.1 NAD-dependent protein deacylase [Bacteroidota bacterium]